MHRPKGLAVLICVLFLWPAMIMAQNSQNEKENNTESKDSSVNTPNSIQGSTHEEGAKNDKTADGETADSVEKDRAVEKGQYAVKLRDLEDRVNRLKEQIFRSKARLSLLAETVLDRKIAGAKAILIFRNEMGGSFKLKKATFLLDGGPIFNKSDNSGNLSDRQEIDLFDGPVMPGDHTLSVVLNYRGHGYGIFSYLKGYAFKTKSSHTFTLSEGKSLKIEIVGFEKGSVTTPLEERPAVRYVEALTDYAGSSSEKKEKIQ